MTVFGHVWMGAAKDLLEVFLLCPCMYANKRESCRSRQQSAVVMTNRAGTATCAWDVPLNKEDNNDQGTHKVFWWRSLNKTIRVLSSSTALQSAVAVCIPPVYAWLLDWKCNVRGRIGPRRIFRRPALPVHTAGKKVLFSKDYTHTLFTNVCGFRGTSTPSWFKRKAEPQQTCCAWCKNLHGLSVAFNLLGVSVFNATVFVWQPEIICYKHILHIKLAYKGINLRILLSFPMQNGTLLLWKCPPIAHLSTSFYAWHCPEETAAHLRQTNPISGQKESAAVPLQKIQVPR